jgi:hypothetical protein
MRLSRQPGGCRDSFLYHQFSIENSIMLNFSIKKSVEPVHEIRVLSEVDISSLLYH